MDKTAGQSRGERLTAKAWMFEESCESRDSQMFLHSVTVGPVPRRGEIKHL